MNDDTTKLVPLAISMRKATEVSPFCKTTLYELEKAGRIQFSRVNGRTLVVYASLQRLIEEGITATPRPQTERLVKGRDRANAEKRSGRKRKKTGTGAAALAASEQHPAE